MTEFGPHIPNGNSNVTEFGPRIRPYTLNQWCKRSDILFRPLTYDKGNISLSVTSGLLVP